jgi:hypothetical protein
MSFPICATCAVEHAERTEVCAICADERQWVPATGQAWTTLEEMARAGYAVGVEELETGLYGVSSTPSAGIGQLSKLLQTPAGNILWDPIGYVDDAAVAAIGALGPVAAIAASHPHMYGVQVEWSRALGGVPIYVSADDAHWVARPDAAIRTWSRRAAPLPGVTLVQVGGHFPGSSVVHFTGRDGRGVLLTSDSVYVNPDRASLAFMRSFPNRIPLSPAVVERIVTTLDGFSYDRIYHNFRDVIAADAEAVMRRSADRHQAWARGDHDDLT